MPIPINVIVNADDLGLNRSVNEAILFCFNNDYINSTSLLTNTNYFESTVDFINSNPVISNIGVHINLADGKPVSDFKIASYLDDTGNWNLTKTNKVCKVLGRKAKTAFAGEIYAQIEKALTAGIDVTHLDSHYHLHTLPHFFRLFLDAAKYYSLKLRIAQTYYENSYIKFFYRRYINMQLKSNSLNYSERFETVNQFLKHGTKNGIYHHKLTEIMLHPGFNSNGELSDHFDPHAMVEWLNYVRPGG